MQGTAIYRLPYGDGCTCVEGSITELLSCAGLNGRQGFVVAPFQATAHQPILLISPDSVQQLTLPEVEGLPTAAVCHDGPRGHEGVGGSSPSRLHYTIDFANFHAQLMAGVFEKIVLARCAAEPNDGRLAPLQLFCRACRLYPRLFVALVTTPQSGTWLTATPEVLLEGCGGEWRTMALAGTMRLEGDELAYDWPPTPGGTGLAAIRWSTKNIQEQRVVATYITECLEQFTANFREDGPRTVRAANLVHLRSDFNFTTPGDDCLGGLLQTLHPTPAVCGLPKGDALNFIVRNEHTPRRYYSGFMGPLAIQHDREATAVPATHLYVSLRCMNIARDTYYLYAGGGLMRDSSEQQEWAETEAKLETMRALIVK